MPADFTKCVRDGGKVVTKELPKGRYVHGCRDKKGNWHWGEVLKKQNKSK